MNYVILAGGTGTRLWPLSRNDKPKQFNQIISHLTMLEETINRLGQPADKIYISTTEIFADLIQKILPDFPTDHIIVEPEKRDTGPAMALVAAVMAKKAPGEPMAFIPSDQYIRDTAMFRDCLEVADTIIRETGKLVDIGIVPTFPNPNLGYVQLGEHWRDVHDIHLYKFAGHTEKPSRDIAREYLKHGNYLWHANYYMWLPEKFLDAYRTHAPEIGDKIEEVADALIVGETDRVKELYQELPRISIDYAVMEKMDHTDVLMIKGEFGWSDIGTWEQLYEQRAPEADENGNVITAKWSGLDTSSSLVMSQTDRLIATIGISDLVVVDTPDALLICPRGRAQDVKKMVDQLKDANLDNYL